MSTYTKYLNLELPRNGEYRDSWEIPVNENLSKVDAWAGTINAEIQDARFTKASLKEFLEVSHETDGTLKPTSEVESTRNSFLYGHKDGTELYRLNTLSFKKDQDMWEALAGKADLRDGLAYRMALLPNQIISGAKTAMGYPAWSGYTGAKVIIDGASAAIFILINGHICRIRTEKDVEISGAAGDYYVYAEYQPGGQEIDTGTAGVAGDDGNGEVRLHQDAGKNYVTGGVQVGDLLRYASPTTVEGDYLIEEVAPNGNVDELLIRNLFPETAGTIAYSVIDPLDVTLGFTDDPTTLTENQHIIADAVFDGASVTSVTPRHFGSSFVSEWRAIDVSSITTFSEIFNHNLGTDMIDVVVQASQANDGTQPVEELSLSKINNGLGTDVTIGTLAVGINNNLTHDVTSTLATATGGTDPHTHAITGGVTVTHSGTISASLTGVPAVSLTGDVTPYNSVVMKASRNQVWVKNAVASLFYRDYDNANRQTGYLRVIVTRKG